MLRIHEEEKLAKEKAERNNDYFIGDLEKQLDRSKNKSESAIKQFDTLMIAISTAGIGFVAAYIKDLDGDLFLARMSQSFFVGCLFINLFSHIFSSWVNTKVVKYAEDDLNVARYKHFPDGIVDEDEFETHQDNRYKKKKRIDITIITLNIISMMILLVAIILFLVFVRN